MRRDRVPERAVKGAVEDLQPIDGVDEPDAGLRAGLPGRWERGQDGEPAGRGELVLLQHKRRKAAGRFGEHIKLVRLQPRRQHRSRRPEYDREELRQALHQEALNFRSPNEVGGLLMASGNIAVASLYSCKPTPI